METNKKVILIVEDNIGLNILLTEKTEAMGYNPVSAHSGNEALDWLKSNNPYLMILDYSLPDMTGNELLTSLISSGQTIPPFIVSTGQGDESIAVEMMKQGARDYLVKNMHFLNKLSEVLKRIEKEIDNEIKRNLAEQALVKSESRHSKMVANIGDVIVIIDKNGINQYKSANVEKLFGWKPEDLIGKSSWDNVHPDDLESVQKFIEDIAKEINANGTTELRYKKKDGTFVWIEITVLNLLNNPDIGGILGNYHEITDRKKVEEALRDNEQQLKNLFENAADAIFIAEISTGIIIDANSTAELLLKKPLEKIIGLHQTELHPPETEDFSRATFLKQRNELIQSNTMVPVENVVVCSDGSCIPVEILASKVFYKGKECQMGTFRNITERKKAEEALLNERLLLRTLIDNIPDAIYLKDLETRKTIANIADVKNMGVESELDVIGKTDFELFPKEVAEKFFADDKSVMETGNPLLNKEEFMFDENGIKKWLLSSKLPLRNQTGQIIGLLGIGRDITETKLAEEALSKSEAKHRTVIEQSNDGIVITDENGNIDTWNESMESITGIKKQDSIGKPLWEVQYQLIPHENRTPEILEKIRSDLKNILESKIGWLGESTEQTIICTDGKIKVVQDSSFIVKTENTLKIGNIIRDITERKQAELEIITTRNRLKKAQSIAHIGNWELDLATGIIWASDEAFNIYGIENTDHSIPYNVVKEKPLPEYRPIIAKSMELLITQNKPSDIEFQILCGSDNELRSIRSIAEVEKVENGKVTKIIGIIQDITEQKKLENELRVLSNAIEQSPVSIVITNTEGAIEYVNPKFNQLTGYSNSEVLGNNPRTLKTDYKTPEEYANLWTTISEGKIWHGEFCNKKKDGTLYWESAVISPVFDSFGKITHYVAVKEDITDKREADRNIINAVIEGEERERNRFSRELHDGLGPLLSIIKLYFQWMAGTEDQNKKFLLSSKGNYNIEEAIQTLREISNNLSPRSLNTFGIVLAIRNFIERFEQMDEFSIEFLTNIETRFNKNIEVAIYRVVTELINNCVKHANAKNIYINLNYYIEKKLIELVYTDNGKGMDLKKNQLLNKGKGLQNIHTRVDGLNGKINIESSLGNGMKVIIELPVLQDIQEPAE